MNQNETPNDVSKEETAEVEGSEAKDTEASSAETKTERTYSKKEVEDLIEGRLAKARRSWDKEQAEKQSEADKLAKMDADQKKTYAMDKREKELQKREAEITKRELQSKAREMLTQKGLPLDLANILDYTDADACNASIENVEKAFNQAVETNVDAKLKGGPAMKKAPENKAFTKEEIKNMTPEEINANWDAVSKSLSQMKK